MYGHIISAAGSSLGSAVLGAAPALAAWKAVVDSSYLHTPAQAENATTGVIHIPDLTDVPLVSNATSGGSLCGVVACAILAAVGPPFIFTRNTRKTYKATPPPLPPSRPIPQECAFSDKTITDDREEDAGGSGDPPPPPPPPPPPSSEPDRLPEADKTPHWNWFLLTLAALNEVFTKRHRAVGLSHKTADGIPTHLPRVSQLGGVCSNQNPLERFSVKKGMPTVGLDRVPSGGRTNSHDILAPVWVFFPRAIAFFVFFGLLRIGSKDEQPAHELPACVDSVPNQESPNPPGSGSVEFSGLQPTNITHEEGITSATNNTPPPSATSRMKLNQDQPMTGELAFKLNPNVRPFIPSVLKTTSLAGQGAAQLDLSAVVLSRRENSARNAALRTARHIPLPIQPPLLPRATPSFLYPEQTNSTPRDPLQNISHGDVFPFRQPRPSILHPHPGGVPRQCAPRFMSNMPVVTGTAQSSLSEHVSCGIPGDVPFAGDLSCTALPCKHLSHPPSLQVPSCSHGWSPACGILCPLGLIDNLKPSTNQSQECVQIARLGQSN